MPVNSFADYPMSWKPKRESLSRPIYQSLALQLERDIQNGILFPGIKLPPQRELADFLDINFTTVTRAYKICELRGLLVAVVGDGTYVAQYVEKPVTISTDRAAQSVVDLGFFASFTKGNQMVVPAIRKIAAGSHVYQLLDYDYPTGLPRHRQAGIQWLSQFGIKADPDHIAVTCGAQNALTLTLMALFEPGNRIAVEEFSYANLIELAKMLHIKLVPVACDEDGMRPEALEEQCRLHKLHGIFLMPSCCNPTTVMMSEKRRESLAAVIQSYQLYVIEDDILSFLTSSLFEKERRKSMFELLPEQSVYICGTSKSICSGLRVAFITYPDCFKNRILKALYNVNVKTSSLDTEVIAELILSGKADEIALVNRDEAKAANIMCDSFFPNAVKNANPYSYYRWIPIRDERSGFLVESELEKKGIRVCHSDRFLCGPDPGSHFIRIALDKSAGSQELQKGLTILKDCNIV